MAVRFSIALAWKGDTGKTTLAGMLIKYLVGKWEGILFLQ